MTRHGMRLLAIGLGLVAFNCRPQVAEAADTADAIAVVAELHAVLVEVAGLDPAPDLDERTRLLTPVVTSSHDLTRMGRLTVRRFWNSWSEAEQQAFIAAFERLSIATYASRFASVGPDTFEILDGESDDDRAEVRSRIRRKDGDDVTLDYTLGFDGERWRIVNILADGASELSVMAATYFDILDSGSLDDVIAEIETEIAEL